MLLFEKPEEVAFCLENLEDIWDALMTCNNLDGSRDHSIYFQDFCSFYRLG